MNPDQLYTTQALHHSDLIADAERERQLQQLPGLPPPRRRGLRGLLIAGAGGVGAALLALSLTLSGDAPARAGANTQPFNRIFADEARYTPSLAEYLAVMPTTLDAGDALAVRRAPEATQQSECRVANLPGLALCAPGAVAPSSQGAGALRVGGPR